MIAEFDPKQADDFLGDEVFGVFINTGMSNAKEHYYTLTKVIEDTPYIHVADEGPFDEPLQAIQSATNHAQRIIDGQSQ